MVDQVQYHTITFELLLTVNIQYMFVCGLCLNFETGYTECVLFLFFSVMHLLKLSVVHFHKYHCMKDILTVMF